MFSPKYFILNPYHTSFTNIPKGIKCDNQSKRTWCVHASKLYSITKHPKKPESYGLSSFR